MKQCLLTSLETDFQLSSCLVLFSRQACLHHLPVVFLTDIFLHMLSSKRKLMASLVYADDLLSGVGEAPLHLRLVLVKLKPFLL